MMCWSYNEVHAGTEGFSPSLQVGEGGFGVVYRASLKNTDCAVKRLKQVSQSEHTPSPREVLAVHLDVAKATWWWSHGVASLTVCVATGLPAGLGPAEGELPHGGRQIVEVSNRLFPTALGC